MNKPAVDDPRDVLLAAAIGVVERAGTSEVTVAEVAAAASVDADVASALFESASELLIAATIRLATDDLRLELVEHSVGAPTASSYAHHFAKRRGFYRAMRFGPVTELLDERMAQLVAPLIAAQVRTLLGGRISDDMLGSLAAEVTAESFAVTTEWIVESNDAEGAEALYVRLEAMVIRRLESARLLSDEF